MRTGRRRFLQLAAVTPAVSLPAASLAASQLPAASLGAPRVTASQQTENLPEPIRALLPVTGQIHPITDGERQQRIAHAQRLMREHGIDAVFMRGGSTLFYFAGIRWWNSERMMAMVLPRDGDPAYIVPAFEESRAREQIRFGHDVRTWQENECPYARVHELLADLKFAAGRLGIEEQTPYFTFQGIAQASPALHLTSADAVTVGCRAAKSAAELALMRLANETTLAVYRAVWQSLATGMTQQHASALVDAAYARMGVSGGATVQVGQYSALPHGSRTPQKIAPGQIIMIDDGCQVDGYNSDITRTFVLGEPSEKMRSVFEIVQRAQTAALRAARPGVAMEDVDAAARKVIADAGYGPGYRYFTHRLGHGIGLDGHEWPYLVQGNTAKLAPGMTFSDEPGIYIPGEFGVRLEDDMYIAEDGAHWFTPQSPSLEHPFG